MRGVKQLAADPNFRGITEIITVDPHDRAEARLLRQFGVDGRTADAVTVFIAPPANVVATFKGATSKNVMLAKLTAAASSHARACDQGGCATCPYRMACSSAKLN